MTIDERLDILESLWLAWAEHGRAMTGEQWRRPTRLGDWDVRSLYAHAGSWPVGLSSLVDRRRDTEPTHPTAAVLLREFNAPDGVANRGRARIASGAREDSTTYTTEQMVGAFAGTGPGAIAVARRLGPVVVDYFGLAMLRLDEAISIGIVEATVHLLDLERALDRAPAVPPEGLAHTVGVLVQMASPVDLVEAATGRGGTDLFPLMS
jgi:hypothetical protein